ncbi:MAG TPA: hypothetical protein VL400_24285 [Polyangiaceae bacterium]|nr:hypothetical protein [Polyangiaceae bacterium]
MSLRNPLILTVAGMCLGIVNGCDRFDSCPPLEKLQPSLDRLPTQLSETGLFRGDDHTLADGVLAYTPAFELWSDGATKRRFIWLPENGVIDVSDPDDWQFPKGTKLWKEFSRDGKRVETRLLEKTGDGPAAWAAAAYVWDDDERDARLTPLGMRNARGTEHDVPAADRCVACHGGRRSRVLGFSAIQLGNASAGNLSLADLEARGVLSGELPDMTVPGDDVERAALGYLHANCSHCHNAARPASDGPRCYDPENELDMFLTSTRLGRVGDTPTYATVVGSKVEPGHPEDSKLFELVSRRSDDETSTDQMPPLATERVDEAGVALLAKWITQLPRD